MSAHTSGPWKIIGREVDDDGSVSPRHIVGGPKEFQVCLLEAPVIADLAQKQPGSIWDTNERKEADARLIAAAPELLEAARFVVKYADSEPDGGQRVEMHRANVERCRAAIAKATGGAA